MLLENKNAIIYGGGGAIGAAVAKAFAKEGARVFLAGRTIEKLEVIAKQISQAGGFVETAVVDVLNKQEVESYISKVVEEAGTVDISFNAISFDDVQGYPLIKMRCSEFTTPTVNALQSYFISATAAARYMMRQGSGVILAITANASRTPFINAGGFGITCAAIEAFCRQLAVEVGEYGIRVICLRSAGSPDAPGVHKVLNQHAQNAGISREEFEGRFAERTMLKRLPKLSEVADAAVLMVSDKASAITAAVTNVTCGEIAD